MKKYYTPLFAILSILPAFGGAQTWNIWLSDDGSQGPTSYTIPNGKVYILEAVSTEGSASDTQVRVTRSAANIAADEFFNITVNSSYSSGETIWLPNKLRLKAGEKLHLPNNGTFFVCHYFGILIDEADLYAANLPVELNNPRVDGSQLMADAKVRSPRPHKLVVQTSEDMSAFGVDATAQVTATVNTGESTVSVDKGTTGKKFMRVMAKTIPRK